MKLFAFVGNSNTGKTRMIAQLVPVLKHRGFTVAVIKHCAHGFELDTAGKDSWNFTESNADAVAMVSPDRLAIISSIEDHPQPENIAVKHFEMPDIVLVEGFRGDKGIRKIEVLRKEIAEKLESAPSELFAVVADFDVDTDKPLFHPDQIEQLADQIQASVVKQKSSLSLHIDGESIPMNDFVQKILTNAIMGMIGSLEGIKENPKRIAISLLKKGENDANT
ncbi:MAG: molybdopterin-guanine dinucleotide biosynthesis protein B [Candidatus Aminicenantes bacterium]|jgi:molybdopterin-guanine dinucleotide biosynthesis protein B